MRLHLLLAAIAVVAVAGDAYSQTISRREARSRVEAATQAAATVYERFPRLLEVDQVVRSDCEAAHPGRAASSEFCGCAAAVTMSLWRSGIDPQMIARLQTFLTTPDASAEDFIAYQGPELYGPLCERALGG